MKMREKVQELLARRGDEEYAGEPVSQLQHALQCAALAEKDGADKSMVTAALLHDIGHLFDDDPDALASEGIDTVHEDSGADFLSAWFGPEVTEPVRLHVAAKRWLCAKQPGYLDTLSPASQRSLELQGGVFSEKEADDWLSQDYAKQGLQLRKWDDEAKDPDAVTPSLDHYLDIAEQFVR